MKERAYPEPVTRVCDVVRFGELKLKIDETILAAYDEAGDEKSQDTFDCELELCEHLQSSIPAPCDNVGGNRSGLDDIHINGN